MQNLPSGKDSCCPLATTMGVLHTYRHEEDANNCYYEHRFPRDRARRPVLRSHQVTSSILCALLSLVPDPEITIDTEEVASLALISWNESALVDHLDLGPVRLVLSSDGPVASHTPSRLRRRMSTHRDSSRSSGRQGDWRHAEQRQRHHVSKYPDSDAHQGRSHWRQQGDPSGRGQRERQGRRGKGHGMAEDTLLCEEKGEPRACVRADYRISKPPSNTRV